MILSIPLEDIEKQLIIQLTSLFIISTEEKELINEKMGGDFAL